MNLFCTEEREPQHTGREVYSYLQGNWVNNRVAIVTGLKPGVITLFKLFKGKFCRGTIFLRHLGRDM